MKKDHTGKQLLQQDSFLRWKLLDDSDAKAYWENYIKENPGVKVHVEEAEEILKTVVRFNDYTLTEQESLAISQAIQERLHQKRKKKVLKIIFPLSVAAACLALIVWMNPFAAKDNGNIASMFIAENQQDSIDSKNIRMIIGEEEYLQFEEDADIKYDSSGRMIHADEKPVETKPTPSNIASATLNKLIVPKGRRSSLLLADGTKIWVNSGTTVEFPNVFNEDKREIKVDGEIYIEVAKDAGKPFYVNTPELSVIVLGTRFNISSYKEDRFSNVALVEGKVEIAYEHEKYTLYPDQLASVQDKNVEIKQVNVYDYISWKDGLLQFNSEPLPVILKRISRYYDVSITAGEEINDMKCTGKLVLFDDMEKVLETIANVVPIRFEVNHENKILINKK
ncbi:MAG: FecR domain-containing protein [Tannerella sp.]|jgi:ferric-dicitrate binding protein FerR (iron transport regulator)|nr:FecR domain-containing protein [Tannerella sp.]